MRVASSSKNGSDSMLALGGMSWGWVTSFQQDDGSTVGVSSPVLASTERHALARAETDTLRDRSKRRSNFLLSSLFIGVGYLFRSWPSMRKQPCYGGINILGLAGHLSKLIPYLFRELLGNARGQQTGGLGDPKSVGS